MTTMYNAYVEFDERPDETKAERMSDALVDYHVAISGTPGGNLAARISLPAESIQQAGATALAVITAAAGEGARVVGYEIYTEELFFAREGWEPVPELVSVTEVAQILKVTRQRVLQLVDEGKLPRTKVGNTLVFPMPAVEALANSKAS